MYNLSDATAKGRANTAGCTKLAVFFLACLCFFTACPLNASVDSDSFPYVVNGKLYNHPVSIYHEPVNGGNGRSVVNGWGLVVGSSKNTIIAEKANFSCTLIFLFK